MGEFDLIARYFKQPSSRGAGGLPLGVALGVALGIGDDCALLQPRPGTQLAVSTDLLVEGRHFFTDVDPAALGHKSLAVNLSDLAACGAKPLAFTLALSLPAVNEAWLAGFSSGLFALADAHRCTLVGGDTTRGPLAICITVFGEVPVVDGKTMALLRSGARAGDDLYVSGHLGDARMALEVMRGSLDVPADVPAAVFDDVFAHARARLERPTPRVALGQALRGVASAAIDVSDGLLGDLGHVLKASGVGATVHTDLALATLAAGALRAHPRSLYFVMAGGDDYELAFTAPVSARAAVQAAAQLSSTPVTRIGQIDAASGLRLVDAHGAAMANDFQSFDHFR
jgi:thiamine-monophosphate kinase